MQNLVGFRISDIGLSAGIHKLKEEVLVIREAIGLVAYNTNLTIKAFNRS